MVLPEDNVFSPFRVNCKWLLTTYEVISGCIYGLIMLTHDISVEPSISVHFMWMDKWSVWEDVIVFLKLFFTPSVCPEIFWKHLRCFHFKSYSWT